MFRIKLCMLCSILAVILALTGCGCGSEEFDSSGQNNNGSNVKIKAQIQYWQDGKPDGTAEIRFVTSQDPNPPAVTIIQGRTFRIIAQRTEKKNGKEIITEINPATCIGKVNWGNFPSDKVVAWFETDIGYKYHLDAQFPSQTFCARVQICKCEFSFPFKVVCFDQL